MIGIVKKTPSRGGTRSSLTRRSRRTDCSSTVTLSPGSTTTTLNDPRIGPANFIGFMPLTVHAATAAGGLHVSARAEGQATLTHASTADSDKTFGVLVIGGIMPAPSRGLFDILSRRRPEAGPPSGLLREAQDLAPPAPGSAPQRLSRYLAGRYGRPDALPV